jgi:glycerol kinase
MEKYVWSLDISTTNIGCALWDSKGKLIELKHLELKLGKDVPIEDRDIHKAEIFRKYVLDFKERVLNELNGEITNVIVEEPLGGSNNPSTASLLFGFNGICRYILFGIFDLYPMKISVYDSRRLFCSELVKTTYNKKGEKNETLSFPPEYVKEKKLYIWKKVCKLEPQIEWFYKKDSKEPKDMCFDMSDSYAVGYAGLKVLGIIK